MATTDEVFEMLRETNRQGVTNYTEDEMAKQAASEAFPLFPYIPDVSPNANSTAYRANLDRYVVRFIPTEHCPLHRVDYWKRIQFIINVADLPDGADWRTHAEAALRKYPRSSKIAWRETVARRVAELKAKEERFAKKATRNKKRNSDVTVTETKVGVSNQPEELAKGEMSAQDENDAGVTVTEAVKLGSEASEKIETEGMAGQDKKSDDKVIVTEAEVVDSGQQV